MNRTTTLGAGLVLGGVLGYLAGLSMPYPGRAFSITTVMLGISLAVVGRGSAAGDPA